MHRSAVIVAWLGGAILSFALGAWLRTTMGPSKTEPTKQSDVPHPGGTPGPASPDTKGGLDGALDGSVTALMNRRADFHERLGTPLAAPEWHSALGEARDLESTLAFELEQFEVSCRVYPCTVVFAADAPIDPESLAALIETTPEHVHLAPPDPDGRFVGSIAVVPSSVQPSPDEQRWIDTVRTRHLDDFTAFQLTR